MVLANSRGKKEKGGRDYRGRQVWPEVTAEEGCLFGLYLHPREQYDKVDLKLPMSS
jgi:hypothetical protein